MPAAGRKSTVTRRRRSLLEAGPGGSPLAAFAAVRGPECFPIPSSATHAVLPLLAAPGSTFQIDAGLASHRRRSALHPDSGFPDVPIVRVWRMLLPGTGSSGSASTRAGTNPATPPSRRSDPGRSARLHDRLAAISWLWDMSGYPGPGAVTWTSIACP